MFVPDDPLAPPEPRFAEPWHAQVLAVTDALVTGGHVTATQWAEALGAELESARARNAPDTDETYYLAALSALERLTDQETPLTLDDMARRKDAWADAYRRTPHGQPVVLGDDTPE